MPRSSGTRARAKSTDETAVIARIARSCAEVISPKNREVADPEEQQSEQPGEEDASRTGAVGEPDQRRGADRPRGDLPGKDVAGRLGEPEIAEEEDDRSAQQRCERERDRGQKGSEGKWEHRAPPGIGPTLVAQTRAPA
jgi:hypothetical protein